MFDIAPLELLLIVIVAVVVIGPKDLPLALRTAGRWMGRVRKISGQFRAGLDAMIREAEIEEMEKKWREQNEKIMRDHPADAPPEMEPTGAWPPAPSPESTSPSAPSAPVPPSAASADGPGAAPPASDAGTAADAQAKGS